MHYRRARETSGSVGSIPNIMDHEAERKFGLSLYIRSLGIFEISRKRLGWPPWRKTIIDIVCAADEPDFRNLMTFRCIELSSYDIYLAMTQYYCHHSWITLRKSGRYPIIISLTLWFAYIYTNSTSHRRETPDLQDVSGAWQIISAYTPQF